MKQSFKLLSLLALILVSFSLLPAQAQAQEKGKTISLFNGKNLRGWQIYGNELWYVDTDGDLVCESEPNGEYGYLGTLKHFKDFVITVHFKLEGDNGNSGLFFHSSIDGVKISGWQAEVAPPGDNTAGIYESYGRGWLVKPDDDKDDVKLNEWNTMKLRVKGDSVDTWLNGEHMCHLTDEKIGSSNGQIALQIHTGGGTKVRWKKLELTEL